MIECECLKAPGKCPVHGVKQTRGSKAKLGLVTDYSKKDQRKQRKQERK